jgi:hypothetical protein
LVGERRRVVRFKGSRTDMRSTDVDRDVDAHAGNYTRGRTKAAMSVAMIDYSLIHC